MSEKEQKILFNEIASLYEAHYGDACSQQYRQRFINEPMFDGISLSGKKVVEAMSGSGETTGYLLSKGARVTGIDLSVAGINSFKKRWPGCSAICASILNTGFKNNAYDCVVSVGGLHHLHPSLDKAVSEIHRILKPGGYFCFSEPHTGSAPDLIRRYWYRHDNFFADNEAAINLKKLKDRFSSGFTFEKEIYMGNIAYLFVLNSLIFRIPVRIKPFYTPALLRLESMINRFQGKFLSCFAISGWRKK